MKHHTVAIMFTICQTWRHHFHCFTTLHVVFPGQLRRSLSHCLNPQVVEVHFSSGIQRSDLNLLRQHVKDLVVCIPQMAHNGQQWVNRSETKKMERCDRKNVWNSENCSNSLHGTGNIQESEVESRKKAATCLEDTYIFYVYVYYILCICACMPWSNSMQQKISTFKRD